MSGEAGPSNVGRSATACIIVGADSAGARLTCLGQPVRIVDLARDLIRLSGLEVDRDIAITFQRPQTRRQNQRGLFSKGRETRAQAAPSDSQGAPHRIRDSDRFIPDPGTRAHCSRRRRSGDALAVGH